MIAMIKAFRLSIILCLLIVLLIPASFSYAAESGPRISHICVPTGSDDTIALVVWPGAPAVPADAPGSLTISWSGGTFDIPLTYDHTSGTAAKWMGVVPSGYTGTLVVIAGWVLDPQYTIQNLPFTFEYGKPCTPTAVELQSLSARSQSASPFILVWALFLTALGLVVVKRS
jgi:hypothetical protein